MKHIFLNLKRFDIPPALGGVNRIAPIEDWGEFIVNETGRLLSGYIEDCKAKNVEFVQYFPEAHLVSALGASTDSSNVIEIGCQGVYRMNTAVGGNFGAFTTNRPVNAMVAMGCFHTIIGHCEERNDKAGILSEAGVTNSAAINRLLNQEVKLAVGEGMKVLYCIGEKSEEQEEWEKVLGEQLDIGLDGVDLSSIVIGYEPVWSIGPGKTPADKEYITKIARFIKKHLGDIDVVYGGGLKQDNAIMLSSIEEIDGGLIALTRFTGEIGFYPSDYAEIIKIYLGK